MLKYRCLMPIGAASLCMLAIVGPTRAEAPINNVQALRDGLTLLHGSDPVCKAVFDVSKEAEFRFSTWVEAPTILARSLTPIYVVSAPPELGGGTLVLSRSKYKGERDSQIILQVNRPLEEIVNTGGKLSDLQGFYFRPDVRFGAPNLERGVFRDIPPNLMKKISLGLANNNINQPSITIIFSFRSKYYVGTRGSPQGTMFEIDIQQVIYGWDDDGNPHGYCYFAGYKK